MLDKGKIMNDEDLYKEIFNIGREQSDIIKNMWDKEKGEKGYATFDEDILTYFNITDARDKYDYATLFTEYIGGFDEAFKIIDKII